MKALKELPCPLTNNFALPSDTSAQAASCRCKQRLTRRIRSFAEERSQLPASCLQTYDSWLHTAQLTFADESAEIEAAAACRASLSYSQLKLLPQQSLHTAAGYCKSQTSLQSNDRLQAVVALSGFPEEFAVRHSCSSGRELFAKVDDRH